MADDQKPSEPTPDEIAMTILIMLGTLHLLDGFPGIPFPENVSRAVKGFDRPEIRNSLVDRLYHPERYAPKPQT